MALRYAEVVLNGRCENQDIVNILWYYMPLATGTPLQCASDLMTAWAGQAMARFVAAECTLYTLEFVDISLYNVEWEPELAAPHRTAIGLAGDKGGTLMGQSTYAPINFTLDYSFADVPPGHGPVKRTYIAFGPLTEGAVDNQHRVVLSDWAPAVVDDLMAALANVLVVGGLGYDAHPIRAGSTNFEDNGGPDPFARRSWAKISSAAFRSISSDRASRIPTS